MKYPLFPFRFVEKSSALALQDTPKTLRVNRFPQTILSEGSAVFWSGHAYKQARKLFFQVMGLEDCVFCRIARNVNEASIVYSDEQVIAFMDIQPVNPGHTLVIPRTHVSLLAEVDEETGAQMFRVAMRVAEGLRRSGLRCEGINFHLADGEVAGQEVLHVHLHVIPRFSGDGFGIRFGRQYGFRPGRKELDATALRVRQAMR